MSQCQCSIKTTKYVECSTLPVIHQSYGQKGQCWPPVQGCVQCSVSDVDNVLSPVVRRQHELDHLQCPLCAGQVEGCGFVTLFQEEEVGVLQCDTKRKHLCYAELQIGNGSVALHYSEDIALLQRITDGKWICHTVL